MKEITHLDCDDIPARKTVYKCFRKGRIPDEDRQRRWIRMLLNQSPGFRREDEELAVLTTAGEMLAGR